MTLSQDSKERLRLGRVWLLAVVVVVTSVTTYAADQKASEAKTVRLLTIGNSFSRNATRYLDKLATSGGHKLIHRPIIVGGASMELHATKLAKFEANPEDPQGKYGDGSSLQDRLREQPWDVVTIQQASRLSPDVNTYRPFAGQLRDYVRLHSPQARLMVHQTWAYREDDPWFFAPSKNAKLPATQAEMYQKLRNAYFTIARELEAGVIPVGDAFHLAEQDAKWNYRPDTMFDFAKASFPELPNQRHSLHVGWQWKTQNGARSLKIDGHHANAAGEYLGSCVFYEVLFDDDVTKNAFAPENLDAQFASFLREAAHRAVAGAKSQGE